MVAASTDIREVFDVSGDVLNRAVRVLDVIIAGALANPNGPTSIAEGVAKRPHTQLVLPAMLQAMGSSSHTLLSLSSAPGLQTRDCFSIVRSIVELAVNVSFILAEGDSAASRAVRHSKQKAVRDLSRESNVGQQSIRLAISGIDDNEFPPHVLESLDEFTARSGREKGWVDLSIDARCERVGKVFGEEVLTPLHWARFAVYRHSSEILHGTFFGAAYFLGLTSPNGPPSSPDDLLKSIAGQHLMVLMAAVLSIKAVVTAVHLSFGAPELLAEVKQGLADLRVAHSARTDGDTDDDV